MLYTNYYLYANTVHEHTGYKHNNIYKNILKMLFINQNLSNHRIWGKNKILSDGEMNYDSKN